jgi:hypothetical protein
MIFIFSHIKWKFLLHFPMISLVHEVFLLIAMISSSFHTLYEIYLNFWSWENVDMQCGSDYDEIGATS